MIKYVVYVKFVERN